MRLLRSAEGQASVEFLSIVPVALAVTLVVWQLVIAGQTAWLTANAARVAARAEAIGKNPEAAARSALPEHLEEGLVVQAALKQTRTSKVRVRVRVPLLLHRWKGPLSVAAAAGLPKQSR